MRNLLLTIFCTCLAPSISQAALHLESSGKNRNFIYDHDSKALASNVLFVLKTGSLNDPKGKEGLARFSFNSLLRGTNAKSRMEFVSAVENLGAGIEVDAGINRTIITLNSISDKLEQAVNLLAEAILEPALREEELKSLQAEELAGLNQEKSTNRSLLKRAFRQALFPGTPLAFPAEGTITGVEHCSVADVRKMLESAIKSGNVLVAVTSNKPEAEIKTWLEKAFAKLPDGAGPAEPKLKLTEPQGRTLFIVNRKGSSTTEVAIGELGIKANDKDREALETGMYIFGADFTSRIPTVLRKENAWTYGAYASYKLLDLPRRHGGAFLIYAFPQAEFTEKLIPKALELYETYASSGVTEKELKFAQNSLTNSYPFQFAESKSRIMTKLYNALDGAPLLSVPEYRKKVNALTTADILHAIQRVHHPKDVVVVVVGDPEHTKNLAKLIPGIKKTVSVEDPMKGF